MSWTQDDDGVNPWGVLLVVTVLVSVVAGGVWIGYRAGHKHGVDQALASWRCPPAVTCPESPPCPQPPPDPRVCFEIDPRPRLLARARSERRAGWEDGYGIGREDWRCLPWEPR